MEICRGTMFMPRTWNKGMVEFDSNLFHFNWEITFIISKEFNDFFSKLYNAHRTDIDLCIDIGLRYFFRIKQFIRILTKVWSFRPN